MKTENFFIIIFLLSMISCLNLNGSKDEFEGKIIYLAELKIKNNNNVDENILSCQNDTLTVFMKNGNFKQTYYKYKLMKEIIFKPQDNLYNIITRSDTIFSFPANNTYDVELINLIELDTIVNILGYECKAIRLDYSNSESLIFFYTNELKVNPEYYKDYKMYFYNEFIKKSESVYLLSVWETPNFTLTYKAININEEKIKNEIFELPDLPQYKL